MQRWTTFKTLRLAALSGLLAFGAATPAQALGVDDYIGSIGLAGFVNLCPSRTLPADGRLLPIADYTNLFALLGTTYGGDGKYSFALPDLRGKLPIAPRPGKPDLCYCVVLEGVAPARP